MLTKVSAKNTPFQSFPCSQGNPLHCELLQRQSLDHPQSNQCEICNFPAPLGKKAKIKGKEGIYQVQTPLKSQEFSRIYQGTYLIDQKDVIIKEYFLPPNEFTPSEIINRQNKFEQISHLQLIDGRKPDFRVLIPQETIIDRQQQRYYAIIDVGSSALTLEDYLAQYGARDDKFVWQVLDQVLQSLLLLNRQKFRFSSGLPQAGITHGNLSLETLLILPEGQSFLIYLTDLALWERNFWHSGTDELNSLSHQEAIKQDLVNLGYIGFYLLAGKSVEQEGNSLDPNLDQAWNNCDSALKDYLLNLMGLGRLSLDTTDIARQEFFRIRPQLIPANITQTFLPDTTETASQSRRWWWIGGGILALLLLSCLLYWFVRKSQALPSNQFRLSGEKIADISDIVPKQIIYRALRNSSWDYAYTQENLVQFGKSLEEILQEQQPNLKQWQYKPLNTDNLTYLYNHQDNFSIASPIQPLSTQYKTIPIAYEAIAVFVAFNYSQRQDGLTNGLQGKISIEQLQKLYTGKIKKWSDLDPRLPDLEVRIYVPADPEVEAIFKANVLKDPQLIAQYEALLKESSSGIITPNKLLLRRRTYGKEGILQSMIRDFENNNPSIGSIGFDSLSKIMGQCSVYPLALSENNNPAISPLIKDNKQPVTPQTNLCDQKGSYGINTKAIRNKKYPLSYPLAVVYFRDNRRQLLGDKFAEILTTKEGQCLLRTVQLTPLEPVNCHVSNQ
ncbi:MAG: PstS family phosphate ABC transporter substrate-binding protein [Microcystaceae cyanobacterium]